MNNCGRENKKRYVLALCSLPVELGIFPKVKVGFLMVGHMHEDVDQLFSHFSTYLSKRSARLSLPSFPLWSRPTHLALQL